MRHNLKKTPGYMFRPSLGHPQANTSIIKYRSVLHGFPFRLHWLLKVHIESKRPYVDKSSAQFHTVPYSSIEFRTVPYSFVQFHTVSYSSIQFTQITVKYLSKNAAAGSFRISHSHLRLFWLFGILLVIYAAPYLTVCCIAEISILKAWQLFYFTLLSKH
jgi:hypothetical protein